MDFKEYLVKKHKGKKEIIYTVLLYMAALVLAFLSLMFIPPIGGIWLLVIVGLFFGAYKISASFNKEFEYIITDNQVDIDVVFNASARKRLVSFSTKEMSVLASVDDVNQKHLLNGQFSKVIDATTNSKNADVYFAITEENGRTLVKFEPPYAALQILKKHAPFKVFISE